MTLSRKLFFLFFFALNTHSANTNLSQDATQLTNTTGQIHITHPGVFVFLADWQANLNNSNQPAICIASSNVTLDLNGKSLSLSSTSHTPIFAGIALAPGVTDVTVTNGSIIGDSTYTSMPVGITGIDNSRIKLTKLSITGCRETGVALAFGNHITINSVDIRDTSNNQGSAVGLKLSTCKKVSICSSSCKTTQGGLSTTDVVAGIYANNCTSCSFDQVVSSNNRSVITSTYGLFLQNCKEISCVQVHANNNSSTNASSISAGFLLANSRTNILTRCHANANGSISTAAARGFIIRDSSENLVHKCVANSNIAATGTCIGFDNDTSKNTSMRSCKAHSNKGNILGCGFSSNASSCTKIIHAKAIGNNAENGLAIGISFTHETMGTIKDCEVLANNATNGAAYGIGLFQECLGSKILYNIISENIGSVRYGFYDEATRFTTVLCGNVASNHGLTLNHNRQAVNTKTMNYFIPSFHDKVANLINETQSIGSHNLRSKIINISLNKENPTNIDPTQPKRSFTSFDYNPTDLWIPVKEVL